VTVLQLFQRTDLQMPLLIGIVMQMAQQLGGINAVRDVFLLSFFSHFLTFMNCFFYHNY